MDIWVIYSKEMYEKKLKKGTINTLVNYAKNKLNIDVRYLSDSSFSIITDGATNKIYLNKKEIKKFPKIVFFKKYDLYLARQFELLGIKVFNNSESMAISRNKLKTYQVLTKNNIKIPKTIYFSCGVNRKDFDYVDVVLLMGSKKFVIKPSFGSKGKDIYLVNNSSDFNMALSQFKGICMFQEFIDTSKGKDLRSYVINGLYQGSAIRVNENDFRTNYSLGAKVLRLKERDEKVRKLAVDAANAVGLWYCAVDILYDGKEYYVCEVNSVPGRTRRLNTNRRLLHRLSLELKKL